MNIPEGWKLVPVVPTPQMLSEGISAWEKGTIWLDGGPEVYAAMLAAAPTPPAPEVEPVYQVSLAGTTWTDASKELFDSWGSENRRRVTYTHPANDGLRKAARQYLKSCDHGNADERRRDLENLRAELNKDKSC